MEIKSIKQIIKKVIDIGYVVITCKIVKLAFEFIHSYKSVGMDGERAIFCIDFNGNRIDNPLFLEKGPVLLGRTDKKLSKKRLESNNYEKVKRWYQIVCKRIKNKRLSFLQYISKSRAIIDILISLSRQLLEYKFKMIYEFSSQCASVACSKSCNHILKYLITRICSCNNCYQEIESYFNASIEIKKKALKYLSIHLSTDAVREGYVHRDFKVIYAKRGYCTCTVVSGHVEKKE